VGLSRVAGFSLREAIAERVLTVTARVNGTPEEDAR